MFIKDSVGFLQSILLDTGPMVVLWFIAFLIGVALFIPRTEKGKRAPVFVVLFFVTAFTAPLLTMAPIFLSMIGVGLLISGGILSYDWLSDKIRGNT